MADIDKSLPNVKTSIEVDPQEEIEIEQEKAVEAQDPGVEVTPNEDGSVEVNFDPSKVNIEGQPGHFDNLAELLPEDVLKPIGLELVGNYKEYKTSRKDWEQSYIQGLDLLGFKYENRTEPFQGASGATHPVLAEAVTQFQAGAYKELLPAEGPVRTQVVGKPDPAKEAQSQRVKNYMNYELMEKMEEYEPEFDQMLFHLPLAGSTFKKVYYDDLLGRAVSKFIPAEDLIVPYTATSLDDAESIIHTIKISENDLRKQQVGGFYSDVELGPPGVDNNDELTKKERELSGTKKTGRQDDIYTLLECHVNLDLEGFEDKDDELNPTGIKLPYIVTVEESSQKVLSIRRNYEPTDPKRNKIHYFVHFKFLPGLGFYGFGLIHMIGGLSRTATAALRQLLDAGTLSNLPAGFKQRGIRVRDEASPLQPGEFRDVDAPGGNLRDAFMPLPYKEPSPTLLQLMGVVVGAGQRFAAIADMQVGDGNQAAAVGTTVALLERGSRVMSAIHKRLYSAMRTEFKLLSKVFKTYLPPTYPYDVVGATREIKQMDFDDRVDILPVADPNIFSMAQRVTLAQTELQLATSQPQIHNLYSAYRKMYEALGVKNIDAILPPPAPVQPLDPALEHINALGGKPFQAFRGQDHRAHVTAHLNFMSTNMVRNNPPIMAAMQKNILEHISLMAQEQVELEFADMLQQAQQLQMMAQQNPQAQQQLQKISQDIEARKSVLIAELTGDFAKEEKEITSQFDADPLLKLKSREVDLRAMENQRKKEADEAKSDLDRAKLMQAREISDDKLEQNEDLAKLRAGVSLAKTGVQQAQVMIDDN
jgi:phosphoglycolate phosphatase-like HAD superfamily hydrolase